MTTTTRIPAPADDELVVGGPFDGKTFGELRAMDAQMRVTRRSVLAAKAAREAIASLRTRSAIAVSDELRARYATAADELGRRYRTADLLPDAQRILAMRRIRKSAMSR